jgi:3-hydroxyisobutyrate dehydrogenase-like beta-hydroxyacid dehydrogenase
LVHIVMSTLSVAFARELEQVHAKAGIAYIAAPVMGRPDVAAAGKLNILAAGDPAAIERARPLFDVIGQRTWLLGVEPHQANVAKLAKFPARPRPSRRWPRLPLWRSVTRSTQQN